MLLARLQNSERREHSSARSKNLRDPLKILRFLLYSLIYLFVFMPLFRITLNDSHERIYSHKKKKEYTRNAEIRRIAWKVARIRVRENFFFRFFSLRIKYLCVRVCVYIVFFFVNAIYWQWYFYTRIISKLKINCLYKFLILTFKIIIYYKSIIINNNR